MYSEVPIPMYVEAERLVGRRGENLKYITKKSGCQYIWVDFHKRVVEIWGHGESLSAGIAMVRGRIHRLTSVWKPMEYWHADKDLKSRIDVNCWQKGHRVIYDITGEDKYVRLFYEEICKMYPFNPYMTQIEKRTRDGLMVARFSSCD